MISLVATCRTNWQRAGSLPDRAAKGVDIELPGGVADLQCQEEQTRLRHLGHSSTGESVLASTASEHTRGGL
jgi:hypothetical protein